MGLRGYAAPFLLPNQSILLSQKASSYPIPALKGEVIQKALARETSDRLEGIDTRGVLGLVAI